MKGFKVKNKKMEIILKVFLSNLYKFLCKLHDEEMIIFLLKFLPNLTELILITNVILLVSWTITLPSSEYTQNEVHQTFY